MSEERISLADLEGYDDDLVEAGFKATADANAGLPTIEPGVDYLAKVKFPDAYEPDKEWTPRIDDDGVKSLNTQVVLEILSSKDGDETYAGRFIYEFIGTRVRQSTGTTGVQAIVQGMGLGDEFSRLPNHTNKSQAKFLAEQVYAEPIVGIHVDWKVYVKPEDNGGKKFSVNTYKRFPKNDDGTYSPVFKHKELGDLDARVYVRSYFVASPEETQIATETAAKTAPVETKSIPAPQPVAAPSDQGQTAPAGNTVPTPSAPAPQRRTTPVRRTA